MGFDEYMKKLGVCFRKLMHVFLISHEIKKNVFFLVEMCLLIF